MYVKPQHRFADRDALLALMVRHPLGTVRGLREQASDEAGRMADLVMQAIESEAAGRSP